ncbi:MAG: division/cell wall cluster transcriptional repressor MraZ [Gemmatimonadota bacterium]
MGGFLGSYLHQVDTKGRVSLPASFRRESDSHSYVLIQAHADALSLYPQESWREVEERLREMVRRNPKARHYLLGLTANAQEVSPDKQGRILIPDRLRESVGVEREALIVGALERIEIWNPERFEKTAGTGREQFGKLAEQIFV